MRVGTESREAWGPAGYEPPALRSLGSVEELTSSTGKVSVGLGSDEVLKADVETFSGALERLRRL